MRKKMSRYYPAHRSVSIFVVRHRDHPQEVFVFKSWSVMRIRKYLVDNLPDHPSLNDVRRMFVVECVHPIVV
jgi:hypothetical protein